MKIRFTLLLACLLLLCAAAGALLLLKPAPAPKPAPKPPRFADWAVLVVSGDNRAHDGGPSKVFDNGRRDIVHAFLGIGVSPANLRQFSVTPDVQAQPASVDAVAQGLVNLAGRAKGGCLVYLTSHGGKEGIEIADATFAPEDFGKLVGIACGARPSVIVISACHSGVFVPGTQGPNRMVFTAASADRTSFGCGAEDRYTFFDNCFLKAMPASRDFPEVARRTKACVDQREKQLGFESLPAAT